MDNKTKDALKALQAEIRQLQSAMATRPAEKNADDVAATAKGDAVVQYSVHTTASAGAKKPPTHSFTAVQLERVTDEQAAAVGYALASPQKIRLLRALHGKESEGAAELGAETQLSTGSLYHHLRELMRADFIRQAARSRYVLTDRGERVLLILLALAAD
ncbi:MAG: helix-turn-helix domain-containing protein [Armatimonadota bacterium]|nr:helix-turn-helix domain-containing protein [Armatimonadota bacterium]